MIKYALGLLLLLSLAARLTGQQSKDCGNKGLTKLLEEKLTGYAVGQPLNPKQYYTDDWCEAIVTLDDGSTITGELLRYNGLLEKFIWLKKATNQELILKDDEVAKVYLNPQKLTSSSTFKRIKMKRWFDADSVFVFLEVLAEGPVTLFAQRKITESQSLNEYVSDFRYYIQVNRNALCSLKPRKHDLLAAMGSYKDECKLALNEANLGIGNEADLIRAVNYLNRTIGFRK
jgi:hypothetical protein